MVSEQSKIADFDLKTAKIVKPNGVEIDLLNDESTTEIFSGMKIIEDVFTPGVHGFMTFKEPAQMGEMLPLVGGERFIIDIETPGVEDSFKSLQFFIHSVTPVVDEVQSLMRGNFKEQSWTVEFSSYATLYDNYVENSLFEEDSDNFVGKIVSGEDEELGTGLVQKLAEKFFDPEDDNRTNFDQGDFDLEPTANAVWFKKDHHLYPFKKKVQQLSAMQILNYVAEKAVSAENESAANYLFWQDFDRWHFRSLNSIIKETENPRKYYVDNPHQENLLDSIVSFNTLKEFAPLDFIHNGAYLSSYQKISPDYDNPYLDFTSFSDAHKIEEVTYSYQEEFDDVFGIEQFPLITEDFDFEPTDSVKKYDSVYGYFFESSHNDQRVRQRYFLDDFQLDYGKNTNQEDPTSGYNENILWQPMFDITESSANLIKEIVGIKRDLKENKAKLEFKKNLKEKWATYRCSVCCLKNFKEPGLTAGQTSTYNIAAAGSFTDVVDYDPENEFSNNNGFVSSYDFIDPNTDEESDSFYNITMGELYGLKSDDEPEGELRSILFQIDATQYSLNRMIESVNSQIAYCQNNRNYDNSHVQIEARTFTYKNEPPEEPFVSLGDYTQPAQGFVTGTGQEIQLNPQILEDLVEVQLDLENLERNVYDGFEYGQYEFNQYLEYTNVGKFQGDYAWAGALHRGDDVSSPPKFNASYHGIYSDNIGGVHQFPCGGCFQSEGKPNAQPIVETFTGQIELEGEGTGQAELQIRPNAGVEKASESINSLGTKDVTSNNDCVLQWGPSVIAVYTRKLELLDGYRSTLLSSWVDFVNKKVFVQSKKPYLGVPGITGEAPVNSSLMNVKSIKRKPIRGSRYEIFATKESLERDEDDIPVITLNDYVPTYSSFLEEDEHPYYNERVNTSIGNNNGLMDPSVLLGLPEVGDSYSVSNQLVFPSGYQRSETSDDGSSNESHAFEVDVPRYFALSGINGALLQSPEPLLQSVTQNRNVKSNKLSQSQQGDPAFKIGTEGFYGLNKINVDQPVYAYDWWYPADRPFFSEKPLGDENNRVINEQLKYADADARARGSRFGDFYAPFTVFLAPFFGNKNSYSEFRNVSDQPDSDDTRTGDMFELYLRGAKNNASDVSSAGVLSPDFGYGEVDPDRLGGPQADSGDGERPISSYSGTEPNNPDVPRTPSQNYMNVSSYAGYSIPGRVQQPPVRYGMPFGPGNIDPLANNTFSADNTAKFLGLSNWGLSHNYDQHFYRDFGFPGEIIVKITPTSPSSYITRVNDYSQSSGGGGGGQDDTTDPVINPPRPGGEDPDIPQGVPGCTDPAATNYDPAATTDDGSCEYENGDSGGGGTTPPGPPGGGSFRALVSDFAANTQEVKYWNLDGSIQIEIVGISVNGGRGGQLGYTKDFVGGDSFDSPLYRDNGYLEYNVGPQYTNYCDVDPEACDGGQLFSNYVNRSNWYAPKEPYKSPRRFFAEVQSFIRVEFETALGEETLVDFPFGFIRDAGSEYYLPYLVQLTAGPFGRHAANYNMSVIGMDPFGFDIAVTRTDKYKEHLFEGANKPVLYPTLINDLQNELGMDPLNSFYRTVSQENQWAHVSYNKFPIPSETLPSSWHSFKAPMTGVNINSMFESHFQNLIWTDIDNAAPYGNFVNTDSFQSESKLEKLIDGSYRRFAWYGKGYIPQTNIHGKMWNYDDGRFGDIDTTNRFERLYEGEIGELWNNSPYLSQVDIDNMWRYDISGESEYGIFTPPEVSTVVDDAKIDDYIHDLERNFSGQFVVYSKQRLEDACDKYECANPNGPVFAPRDEGQADYDPYINCPRQDLRPDILEFEKYTAEMEKEDPTAKQKFYNLVGPLSQDDFSEPTVLEIDELEKETIECDLIESRLGSEYLGCIYSNPNATNSCNCPEQGAKFKDYLEASRTYATFWDTPDKTPLRREAQMLQLTTQKALMILPGDLTLRPGQLVNIENRYPTIIKHYTKRTSGNWFIGSIDHNMTTNSHVMGVTLFRDSIPHDPNDITEPTYTQD